jgi:hypothetical protein
MATQILASGTTADNSTDVVIAAGSYDTVFFKDAGGPDTPFDALGLVQIKDAAGQYFTIGKLTRHQPGVVLAGPATYRVSRPACATAFGVDKGT